VVDKIAKQNGWQGDWFQRRGVVFHLSFTGRSHARSSRVWDISARRTVLQDLQFSVPSAEYLLALKLKAARILDPVRGEMERLDILNLMKVVGISTAGEAVALLGRYFPASAATFREAAIFC